MSNFVNLHIHSEHSFLDGYSRVEQIAQRAKELGQPAVALTDHGEVNGHIAFQKACRDAEVKPILGMEGYWSESIGASREAKTRGRDNSHITLLAKNQKGLQNLWAWSSLAYEEQNFYLRPQADLALMRQYSEGLYASDGCLLTEFARRVNADDESAAREILGKLLGVFGDSFYMELHPWQFMDPNDDPNGLNIQMKKLNQAKVRFADELGVPLVVVNDAHYARPEDWENHALVWEFNTRGNSDQTGRGMTAAWMMDDDDLVYWMLKHGVSRSVTEGAIKNSFSIAENCNAEISPTLEMPRLSKSDSDDITMFLDLVESGFRSKVTREGLCESVYSERMEEEVEVIIRRGFAGYFNIVVDYVRAAKNGTWRSYVSPGAQREPLLLGPGRGSAGGSLVAYLLGITTLDPLKHGLLFGRFINEGRKKFPDIDVDVPQSKRSNMKDYLGARFGQGHVCGIGTRTRSQPKAMLADLCRVMGISITERMEMSNILDEVDNIEDPDIGWDRVLADKGGDLSPWAKREPKLFQKMGEMVGLARQSSTHASGILVTNKPILGTIPTRIKNEQRVSQFDMHEVEWLGAIKLDLLGLRHLDTLMVARQLVQERHGVSLDFESFGDKEFGEPDIWPPIDKGQTIGIFQLETNGGTKVSMDFKPRNLADVAALIAVNRPGVIRAGLLQHYLRRRHGIEDIAYDHPLMESITQETYGILVYQEQLMEACQALAGFTLVEADGLRELMGKKQIDKLGPMKEKFYDGCVTNSIGSAVVDKIWRSFEAAGSYCFVKSHAYGYGTISSWEVWLKYHYPSEFIVALMRTDGDNINKYLREARKRNINILPPDINKSQDKFTLDGADIRYGLDTVRSVGAFAAKDIMANRPFVSMEDYLGRVAGRGGAKKTVMENLIKIGAFDGFGDRTELLQDFYAGRKDCAQLTIPDFSDEKTMYEIEQELVGNYVTIDPMQKYVTALEAEAIRHPDEMKHFAINDLLIVGGMVTKIKKWKTKKDKDMAFVTVEWQGEDFEVTVFPDAWASCKTLIKVGAPVVLQCIKLERGCMLNTMERLDMVWSA
jgi:DNA polymerase-3 subunit alpha